MIFAGVLLCVAAFAIFVICVGTSSYRGERSDFQRTPSAAISRYPEATGIVGLRNVSFPSREGYTLSGWYAPPRNRAAVILVHGSNSDRSSLLFEARSLAAAGFGILAVDLPGQGASQGWIRWGEGERLAVSAALDWLSVQEEVDRERIGGYGLSLGGYVLIQAAARDHRLKAVALASTPADLDAETRLASGRWGPLSALPAVWALHRFRGRVDEIPAPAAVRAIAPRAVFIIGGERDTWVPPAVCRALFAAALQPKQLWVVAAAGHADFGAVAPEQFSERLVEFFSRPLLGTNEPAM